jgi:hypothetical protein
MAERRYYRCPQCRKRMLGWRSAAGIEHFVCVGPPPCGNRSRPTRAARPPLGPPEVGPEWAAVIAKEVATETPRPGSPSPSPWQHAVRVSHPVVQPRSPTAIWGWIVAAFLAIVLGAALVRAGPFAPAASPQIAPVVAPFVAPDNRPGGPQFNGYVVTCADGWISHSGGRPGACSHHGGIRR